ncbi:MAG: molybdopterin-dependent oxidoreductase [bacterium]|nr:molybdopterin-dependent oxidoreductase [bacterium]
MITLNIDGKEIEIEDGATILEATEKAGANVPTLCYDKRLAPFGACRICLVELEGTRTKFTPSCTTPATNGMVVRTTSPALIKARRTILELLLINHPLDCPVCDKAGECKLQDLVYEYGLSENRFKKDMSNLPIDYKSPLIERNLNRCILCGKCARICDEIQDVAEVSFVNRGMKAKIGTDFDRSLDCEFCGQCIDICPVGALTSKLFKFKARVWELTDKDIICPYCNVGCNLTARSRDGRILKIDAKESGVNEGGVCVKGHFGFDYIYAEDRLTQPLIKNNGKLIPSSWDEAFNLMVSKFSMLKGQVGMLVSPRLTNEEIYTAKEFMNNLLEGHIACAEGLEHLSALSETGLSLGELKEIKNSDCIMLFACLSETNPVAGIAINYAVKRKEANLIVISPIKIKESKLAKDELLIAPGQEITIINEIMAEIIRQNWQDSAFINDCTEGFEPLKEQVTRYTEEGSGVSKEAILSAARLYVESKNPCIILSSPTPDLVRVAGSLLLLKGKTRLHLLGKRSNEVGAFDILGDRDRAFISSARGLFLIGSELPNEALQNKEFIVVSDLYLTETASMADVVLPATASLEKKGTFTNFEGRIQQTDTASNPPCGAKSDLEIISQIALKMGFELPKFKEIEKREFKKGNFLPTQAKDIKISSDYPLRQSRFHSGKISQRSKALMEVSK